LRIFAIAMAVGRLFAFANRLAKSVSQRLSCAPGER
jgi:hypothetical protein